MAADKKASKGKAGAKAPASSPAVDAGESFLIDEQWAAWATREREHLVQAAEFIEAGESLHCIEALNAGVDACHIASVLRKAAEQIPATPPKTRGHQPELDPVALAEEFARLRVVHGLNESQAKARLSETSGKTIEAIANGLKPFGDRFVAMYEAMQADKPDSDKANR